MITGRQGADDWSSAWNSETRLWALDMNGTNSVVRGLTLLHLMLLGGADVHSGYANQVNGGSGNDEVEIPDEVDRPVFGFGTLVVGGPGNDVLRVASVRVEAGSGDDVVVGPMRMRSSLPARGRTPVSARAAMTRSTTWRAATRSTEVRAATGPR